MQQILTSLYFKFFFVPLITSFLCIFVKWVSRNDKFVSFKKEDLSVGLELMVASLIIFITDSVTLANDVTRMQNNLILKNKFIAIPWVLLAFIIGLWGISTLVRKLGWKNETELNIFFGIVLPNILGISSLIFVVSWIGN